jgi:hypothetical protein
MGTLNWYGEMGNGQVGTAKWETARWETAKWDTAKWAVAKLNMMGDKASPCRTPFPISNGLFRSMFILILDELVPRADKTSRGKNVLGASHLSCSLLKHVVSIVKTHI